MSEDRDAAVLPAPARDAGGRGSGLSWCLAACLLWSMSGLYSRYVVASWGTAVLVRNASCGLVFACLLWRSYGRVVARRFRSRRVGADAGGAAPPAGEPANAPAVPGRTARRTGPELRSKVPAGIAVLAVALGAVASVGHIGTLLKAPIANVVIYSSAPVMAAAINAVLFRDQASPKLLGSSVVAIVGVLVVFVHTTGSTATLSGDALAVLMTATTSGVMIVMERHPSIDAKLATFFICVVTAPCGLPVLQLSDLTATNVTLLFICGFSGGLAFVRLTRGVRLLSPVEAGLISTLEVVLAPLWVPRAFGEAPSVNTVSGGTIILTAVMTHVVSATPSGRR